MVQILVGRSSNLAGAGNLVLLTLDADLSQEHEYKNRITSFPVENGLDITDHVRQEPDEIKIEGIVSDSPDPSNVVNFNGNSDAITAYDALCTIAGRGIVSGESSYPDEYIAPTMVDIIGTKNRIFTDMICENLTFPFTVQTGDAIHFTATFKKVRIASTSLAVINYTVSKSAPAGTQDAIQGNVDGGQQNAAPVLDSLWSQITSFLDKIVGE